jgi:hypothetical protein
MRRRAFIRGEVVCTVVSRQAGLPGLGSYRSHASAVFCLYLRCCWPCTEAAASAIEAHAAWCAAHDSSINVGVVDHSSVYADDCGVIAECAADPAAAIEAHSAISETVVDASVEAYGWTPVSIVKEIGAVSPAPIAGGPEQPNGGGDDPCAWNPVVTIRAPCPIPRSPHVVRARAKRLFIHWQWRRSDCDGNADRNCGVRSAWQQGHR